MAEGLAEVELAVLACMASSPRSAAAVVDMLVPRDFLRDEHRVLFATMVDMLGDGQRIDELTLAAELRKDGHEAEVLAAVHELYATASTLASVDHAVEYANVVREESVRRALTASADTALGRAGDVENVVSAMEAAVFDARARLQGEQGTSEFTSASILSPLEAVLSASGSRDGLPYPFPYMRENMGLMDRGTYAILGGYSGDGKTTVALQWIEDVCEAGGKVCLYELEMTARAVGQALMLQGGAITQRQAKGLDPMDEAARERFEDRKRQIAGWNLRIVTGPISPGQMRAEQMRDKYDLLVVDHMQKFPDADDYSTITRLSSQFHRITRDLGCSLLALSQLKTSQDGTRNMPTPQTLRGTRSIEEDADLVAFIWRSRASGRRSSDSRFILGKSREGAADQMFRLTLDTDRVRFFEAAEMSKPSVKQQAVEAAQQEVF